MKKSLLVIIGMLVLMLALTACGDSTSTTTPAETTPAETTETTETTETAEGTDGKVYKIGIVQLMEHVALDDARIGFTERLDELGINYEVDYQNAQGDIGTARTIAEKFVNDKVDLIYAIATQAAEAAVGTGTEIPILFSAVTDPVTAHLVDSLEKPGLNVTGTSDAADIGHQLSLYKELDPSIETIGVIYTSDEINSIVQVDEVKRLAPEAGLTVEEVGIATISDLPQAAQSLIQKVDAMYIVSDNKIASSVALLSDLLIENKKISISAEESQVQGGILLTNGMKYLDLGTQTADMAKRILVDGENPGEIPVEKSNKLATVVNKNTLEALGLDPNLEVLQGAEYVGE